MSLNDIISLNVGGTRNIILIHTIYKSFNITKNDKKDYMVANK